MDEEAQDKPHKLHLKQRQHLASIHEEARAGRSQRFHSLVPTAGRDGLPYD